MILLNFILCFIFGFGIGAIILKCISAKREYEIRTEKEKLISENEKLNDDIKHLKDKLGFYIYNLVGDKREFNIRENYESFDVVLRILQIAPYREENIVIKRFYFKNDFEYAKLCAQELLDELNNTN